MTLCTAALADNRKALIMAADRMISVPFIESELEISKIVQVHPDWWVMLSADSLPGIFPIIDNLKSQLEAKRKYGVEALASIASDGYQRQRLKQAEAQVLAPRGLTIESFLNSGKAWLPEITFRELDIAVSGYQLGAALLVCGFDEQRVGHIFSVQDPGVSSRHDIPGFYAIGSGFYGALYMMYYRELSYVTSAHEWLYYMYEAKAFGEQAGAVGEETELLVAKPGQAVQRIDKDGYQETLDAMWADKQPGELKANDRRALRALLKSPKKKKPASQSRTGSNDP